MLSMLTASARPSRHPPAQAGRLAVLAHDERLAVLEDAVGKLAGCGDPGPADDWEAHLHNRSGGSQPGEVRGGIAQIILA